MKAAAILFFLVILHTFTLWKPTEFLAGNFGDPMAHAAIGSWYCKDLGYSTVKKDLYQAPFGVDLSGNYDSPFPFVVACGLSTSSLWQFHVFTFLQVLLVVF